MSLRKGDLIKMWEGVIPRVHRRVQEISVSSQQVEEAYTQHVTTHMLIAYCPNYLKPQDTSQRNLNRS